MSRSDAAAADDYFARHADQLRPELRPFLVLPRPEPPRVTRARMAELIQKRVAADGSITLEDLERGGFTGAEIAAHFHHAKRIAGVMQMAA